MEISYNAIRLFLNLKKHYESETQLSKNIIMNLNLKIDENCINAKNLEDTFDYSIFEKELVNYIESKEFELIESVIQDIFLFIKRNKLIKAAEVEIIKKGVLSYSETVSIKAYKLFS